MRRAIADLDKRASSPPFALSLSKGTCGRNAAPKIRASTGSARTVDWFRLVPFLLAGLLSAPLLSVAPATAQTPPPAEAPLTPEARSEVVQALGAKLREQYVFPDVAQTVAAALTAKLRHGGYDAMVTPSAFEAALTADLRALGKDGHLRVRFQPHFQASPPPGSAPPPEQLAEMRKQMAQRGFGVSRVQLLTGNIGYLDIRGFFPTEFAAPTISAAMTLLGGTDALIIDLRRNGGGEPDTVAYLLSHFFAEGDARHLNDIYTRLDGSTRSYWTVPSVGARYTRPIYVLTAHDTFSGGEEFAYDVQTQKRGTLVGETTGGGANPGDYVALARGFIAFIPTGRAINPITKTNWEHVGVTPDMPAPATDAMRLAYVTALKAVAAKTMDADDRKELTDTAARAERGEIELPGYTPRR